MEYACQVGSRLLDYEPATGLHPPARMREGAKRVYAQCAVEIDKEAKSGCHGPASRGRHRDGRSTPKSYLHTQDGTHPKAARAASFFFGDYVACKHGRESGMVHLIGDALMSDSHSIVTARCSDCGVAPVIEDNPTDASRVTCPTCGADFGSYAELKAAAIEKAAGRAITDVKTAFDKLNRR